ncbi:hypothetical protein B484DRAFT_401586 [Ochromonadaceae sp. CCMP2298]|nr:hypothetical protein B484DRAFT_401586 [Ochromonadaceae sp. CCMP2298]
MSTRGTGKPSSRSDEKGPPDELDDVSQLSQKAQREVAKSQRQREIAEKKFEDDSMKDVDHLRLACFEVLVCKRRVGTIAAETGYDPKTLGRAVENNDAESVQRLDTFRQARRGRKPNIGPEVLQRVDEEVQKLARRGRTVFHVPQVQRGAIQVPGYDSATVMGGFEALLTSIAHEVVKENNANAPVSAYHNYSAHTIAKAAQALGIEGMPMNQGRNARRAEARADVYNFVSLAAMQLVKFSQITGITVSELQTMTSAQIEIDDRFVDKFDRRLLFNIDKSSTFLGEHTQETGQMSSASRAELEEYSRNAKYTTSGTEDQRRSVGYTAVTSSIGTLDMLVTHVTDHCFNGTATARRGAEMHRLEELADLVFRLTLSHIKQKRTAIELEDKEAGMVLPSDASMTFSVASTLSPGNASEPMFNPGNASAMSFSSAMSMEESVRYSEESAMEGDEWEDERFTETFSVAGSYTGDPGESAGNLGGSSAAETPGTGATSKGVGVGVGVAEAEKEKEEAEKDRIIKAAVLLMDGEYNQVKISMQEGGVGQQCKLDDVTLMKLAAACSSTQQPNDVMKAFAILKAFFRNSKFRNCNPDDMPNPPYWRQLQKISKPVPAASKRTFESYFLVLPLIANHAFNMSCITTGWYKAGVSVPPDVRRILMNCPARSEYGEGGTIPDETMEMYLEKYFGKALDLVACQTATQDRPLNYWRCTDLVDVGTIAEQARRQAAAEEGVRTAQRKKAEAAATKQAKKDGKTVHCCCAPLFGCKALATPVEVDNPKDGATAWQRCSIGNCKKPFCPTCANLYLTQHRQAAHG